MRETRITLGQKSNRILIIDDNPEIHRDFRKVLGETEKADTSALDNAEAALFDDGPAPAAAAEPIGERFEIDSAYQGQEGLAMVQKALEEGRPYAMAFVDVRMPPGWDGVETILQLWRKYPELQVVICTAFSDYSWADITRNLGASDSLVVLKKPFDNIEALQLAHALTKKWLVTRQARARMNDLDEMVRQRTEELEAANERFSKAFRASPLPIAICRVNGARFLDVNESFSRLFGHAHSSAVARSDSELGIWSNHDDQEKFWQLIGQIGRVREMKCRLRAHDAGQRETLIFAEELLLNQERCVLIVFHDVTEQLRLEAQVRQSQKMDAVGQLASGVAHDFNNLLTVIQGHAELRSGADDLDRELADSLKQITRATERAASLTRQLLSFSRRHMTRPRPIDLNEMIDSLGEMVESLVSEQIKITTRLASNLPPVLADPSNLEQVLVNLVVNAKDAMAQGGQLSISTSSCDVTAQEAALNSEARTGSFVCLTVQDTGCGMETAVLNRVFEPFFTTKPMGKGTGMGLAMVYGIVKQHQGWIHVTSKPGEGAAFRIYLPISKEPLPAQSPKLAAPEEVRGDETILVVEDEPDLRTVTADLLAAAGYSVLQAESGVDALRVWFDADEKVDLLLTDIVMPEGMSGRKLAEKLRARKPSLKVLMMSGHESEINEERSANETEQVLTKPFSGSIVAWVRACLDSAEVAC